MHILWTLLLSFVLPQVAATPARTLVVVQWSDIHYGNEEYVADAWHRAYAEGAKLHPDVALLTGDQADNKCSPADFTKRLRGIIGELRPRIDRLGCPVCITLGNNDVAKNYQTDPDNLAASLKEYRDGLGKRFYLDDLGNGVYPRAVGGITWISINTLIFSPNNAYAGRDEQAARTFAWLEGQLKGLPAGRPVALVAHIPPTYDLYDHKLAWRPAYLERFRQIVASHPGPMLLVGGHFHRNEIHALAVPGRLTMPILLAGSLSFKYGNHPNWRSHGWDFDARGHLQSFAYRIRYPGHDAWNSDWSLEAPMTTASYVGWIQRVASGTRLYLAYMADLYAHNAKWKTWAEAAGARGQALLEVWSCTPALAP